MASTKWSPAEIRLLGTASDPAVARLTGRTARAVERKRQVAAVPPWRNQRAWTPDEDKFLMRNAGLDTSILARGLQRTPASVRSRLRRLNRAVASQEV